MRKDSLRVSVESHYLPQHSDPEGKRWLFAYRVRIQNMGDTAATVQRRRWLITDGRGETEEVEGPGIVGATPWLPPTAAFEYTSYCPLPTPTGMMHGQLTCSRDDGSEFDVPIPPFDLVSAPSLVN